MVSVRFVQSTPFLERIRVEQAREVAKPSNAKRMKKLQKNPSARNVQKITSPQSMEELASNQVIGCLHS